MMCYFRRTLLANAIVLAVLGRPLHAADSPPSAAPPNIVYILCDDLGYGDVAALNPSRGKIATPNIDRLAAQGMTFTDAHSGSSVCTPTRYGILTGRDAWRTSLQKGVLNGEGAPLIDRERLTVAELLRDHGYATAAIGKWHLGLTFGASKWADNIVDGPLDHGFDEFFGISASLDMPPFAFIENRRFTEPPTVEKKWLRAGPAAASFEAIDVLPKLTDRAVDFIGKASRSPGKPFFLYLALASPHTPILPTDAWQGRSRLNPYADFVMQTDAAVAAVLAALDAAGVADNTLVIFTSDNGCSPAAEVAQLETAGHFPSGSFRGYKADIWEGGHRVPFIVRWPRRVAAGSRSDTLVCLTDLFATCAGLVGADLPAEAAVDSFSLLPHLLQTPEGAVRESVVHHSIDGAFAIRRGQWKLALCPGSGGWAEPRDAAAREEGLPEMQLYDLSADVGEQHNIAAEQPKVVAELTELLQAAIDQGRTTPGPIQFNDGPIRMRKP
jgi:arylsulfatase A